MIPNFPPCTFLFILFPLLGITSSTLGQDKSLTSTKSEVFTQNTQNKEQLRGKQKQTIEGMEAGMGKLPDRKGLPEFNVQYTDSLKTDLYTRYSINFTVAENETVFAYLYVPVSSGKTKKYPAMLALHETDAIGKKSVDGQGKNANLGYAKELAQRGYVVIAPDYPSFGESVPYDFKKDRYESGTMKGIFNHIRCVDLLETRKDVDKKRIGVIGHSLGGHNAMFVGAFDPRLKVVVTSCGWTLFDYYDIGEAASKLYGGRLGPYAQERYMPLLRDKFNLVSDKMPFDFDLIIAAIAPRAFFSNSPVNDSNFDYKGVEKAIENVKPIYRFLKAENHLQIRYPESKHDFPTPVRQEAYRFIDSILK
jgi:dienelactone hydrolase